MTKDMTQTSDDILLLDDEDEDTMENRYLSFRIEKEDYGIPIKHVIEIIELQKIIEIPDMPEYIKGVINLRGKVIPIMDLRLRFNLLEKEHDDRTCIIIVNIADTRVGLVVDRVEEVLEISSVNIEPPPKFKKSALQHKNFISGIGKIGENVKIILNVEQILSQEKIIEITDKIETK